MSSEEPRYTQNPSIILDKSVVDIAAIMGDSPNSSESTENIDDIFSGLAVTPPVDPVRVLRAAVSSGAVLSVAHVIAQGTTGIRFDIVPRRPGIDDKDRAKWRSTTAEQRIRMETFLLSGYRGPGITHNVRDAFFSMEMDRFLLGWGGIGVIRSSESDSDELPPKPIALSRFEASAAKFSKLDRVATPVPVPVSLSNGDTIWVEVPRFFRRIIFRSGNGRAMWFKEYGDWRAMDAKTGKLSTGNRHTPPASAGKPGKYSPGKLLGKAVPAIEIAHFRTSFPGVAPYGISGWHAELDAVDSAAEHIKLLVAYLKSGLHAIVIAASNRPFETGSAEAAVEKIDELGRGRSGLGALITIALVPQDSSNSSPMSPAGSDDKGRLILHELSTRLPDALLNSSLSDALASKIAQAERIPGLLLGRSDGYNFATAAAAWATVNRLRFAPHHADHEEFLEALTAEMGITDWKFETFAPEWEEKEPLAGITSVTGQLGGVSVNKAMELLSRVTKAETVKIDEWWGDIPMPLVTTILNSSDPQSMLDGLGIKAKIPSSKGSVTDPVVEAIKSMEAVMMSALATARDSK